MQVPYSWIKELVNIPWSPEELAERLTLGGAETEIQYLYNNGFKRICVGQVVNLEAIEGSDHLTTAVVDTGEEKLQVVCGAPNVKEGQKVIFAGIGAELKDGLKIRKARLRGVESHGMICSEAELGLTEDHSGIMVLDEDAEIGMPALRSLGLDDPVLKFDLTPNRPDMLSAIGVARESACLAGMKIIRPEFELSEAAEKASDYVRVSIDDPDACPRYAARIIKGVRIGPSPWWIKRKLLLCGIRPISNVVDITNLVMMEYGHPLHAFDYNRFERKEILVRRAQEGEMFTTLDGQEHELSPEVLLITDGEKGVAAAGVMGGLDSEVSSETQNVLLESAYFNPVTIRRSRLELGMTSESSSRFEKGADPNIVTEAIDRAAYLIQKYSGGKILSGIADCYPKKIAPVKIKLRPQRVNSLLGTDISRERIINILQGLEFKVKDEEVLEITVPTFAPDITREVDLIEEVIRMEGYDSIPSVDRNTGPLLTGEGRDDRFRRDIRSVLTAQGFDEIYSSGLGDSRLLSKLMPRKPQLRILNPIAEDLSVMQNSLTYSLLRSVAHNIAHRNVSLKLFEIGKAFYPGDSPTEEEQIGIAISGRSENNWYSKENDYTFFDLKGAVDSLVEGCQLPSVDFVYKDTPGYADGFSFDLHLAGQSVGHAGQITADVARHFSVKQTVFVAVLNFDSLLSLQQKEKEYKPLPRFPAAPRDLAVVVDDSVNAGDLLDRIWEVGKDRFLEKVEVFDVYRGNQVPENRKSIAFSLIYRDPERSLEGKYVTETQNLIAEHLKKDFKAEVRER